MSALTDYKNLVARTLAAAAANTDAGSSTAARWLERVGLPTDVKVADTNLVVPDVTESEMLRGIPRANLTAAALAAYEVEDLKVFRSRTYERLHDLHSRGTMTLEQVTGVLTALGLPVPKMVTSVEADIKGIGWVEFKVPGVVTTEEIVAALEPQAVDPVGDAVRAAFPNAEGLPLKVTPGYVQSRPVWPSYKGE